VYRRLALVQAVNGTFSLAVGLYLGLRYLQTGQTEFALWALLSTHVITSLISLFLFYVWRPVWRPRLKWDRDTVRYYVTFGTNNFVGTVLLRILDRLDDLWTKFYIGDHSLGIYSRAYTFATYPRELIARPINQVTSGTYAALKVQRRELSRVFFRVNSFLIRTGFYFGGLLFWVAPEFIQLILTDKWMPMLWVFRLMLVFTLLDPLKTTVSSVMVSMGDAARPIPARLVQLFILLLGLYWLGPVWGIEGVAMAVNLMLLVGLAILFRQVRDYVDFSMWKLFFVPTTAVTAALLVTGVIYFYFGLAANLWVGIVLKVGVFTAVYLPILFGLEWHETKQLLRLRHYLRLQTVQD
jgi:O-antigen/teichoic acid export membrane protein